MQYMLMIYNPASETEPTREEWMAMMAPYMAYSAEMREAGAFVEGAPLTGTASATTVRVRDKQRLITDGPFAETKEWLGGYYVIEAATLDAAIEWAAKCPGALTGSIEVRPVVPICLTLLENGSAARRSRTA